MRITPLIASKFGSDGGTMFGLAPKTIWAKRMPPDELNPIPQNANSLLVETDNGRLGIVDTGCGAESKYSEKEISIHGLGFGWPLFENLAVLGIAPERIDFIAFTHLHWDHAGGADAKIFRNAELIVHETRMGRRARSRSAAFQIVSAGNGRSAESGLCGSHSICVGCKK